MKRILFFALFLSATFTLVAQTPAKYWIQFKDKQNTPYSVNQPEKYLSQRAIEKRQQYNIAITEQDFPVNPQYIKMVMDLDPNMIVFTKSKWLNGITVYSEQDSIFQKINALSCVQFCEPTIILKEQETPFGSNYQYPRLGTPQKKITQPGVEVNYGVAEDQIRLNNIHWLHRMGFKGEEMYMVVMDAGFHNVDSLRHFEVLRNENRILGVKNFVSPDKDLFRGDSHGTMVLSCIASDIPGDLVGSAPNVLVYLAKTEDGRTETKQEEDNWVAGIEWADSLGIDVLNSSLGYTKFDDSTQLRTRYSLDGKTSRASQAATIAVSKGMIVCNSAGNEGRGGWTYIGCPADARDILTVGAVNVNGVKANFSSFGPTADGRIKPDVCAVGEATRVALPNGLTFFANGTSFSSPLLSGMVTCLWQAFPEKTNYEIMQAVRMSGHQFANPDTALGYGIADFLKAYNLLRQPNLLHDINHEETYIDFSSYVYDEEKPILMYLSTPKDQKVTISVILRNDPKQKEHKKEYTCKKGLQQVQLLLPKLSKKMKYDLADVKVMGADFEQQFVLGFEHKKIEEKKKK